MNRKEWKKAGRASLKRHYGLFVFICLFIAMLGLKYSSSVSTISSATARKINATAKAAEGEGSEGSNASKIITMIFEGKTDEADKISQEEMKKDEKKGSNVGIVAIGRSRGAFSSMVNSVSSGAIFSKVFDSLQSISHSKNVAIAIFIVISLIFYILVRLILFDMIGTVYKRFFMEGRLYDIVPVRRFLFFARTKRWKNVVLTNLLITIYHILWTFTVVGIMIKHYSYAMVPYILCENPSITPKRAINLSRKMMHGHKWEMFKIDLSFLGWSILGSFTMGLTDILFSNPYKEATLAEYYSYIRQLARENQIPDSDLLDDRLLYEKAETDLMEVVYADVLNRPPLPECQTEPTNAVERFFANTLGVVFGHSEVEENYERKMAREEQDQQFKNILAGKEYPGRLFIMPEREKSKVFSQMNYLRHYSITSIILIFFAMSFIGWSWEVSLHLIEDGVFVNRGIMHGPWLPIYGFGGALIVVVLNKLRKNPFILFVSAVILCGIVEYFTSYYLEIAHNGQKWWDYTGYFLNINGRVCAEGLLIFGLGGTAIVYILAPILDNQFRRIPSKIVIPICVVLLLCYTVDQIYSSKHPNTGKGITDYAEENMENINVTSNESITYNISAIGGTFVA